MSLTSDDVKSGILAAKAEAARRRLAKAQREVLITGSAAKAFFSASAEAKEAAKVADTADPVVNYAAHGRERVTDLIARHAAAIGGVKAAVSSDPLYNGERHDDLWLLRFVLSHKGNIKEATVAARHCLAYRKEHGLDSPSLPVSGAPLLDVPEVIKVRSKLKDPSAILAYVPDPDRGPFLIITPALVHTHAMVSEVSYEEFACEQRLTAEWLYRQCDAVTRRTGYLTKYVRMVNLDHLALGQMNRNFTKRIGEVQKTMDDVYPQLLGALLVCNPPSFFSFCVRKTKRPLKGLDGTSHAPPPISFSTETGWAPALGRETRRRGTSATSLLR